MSPSARRKSFLVLSVSLAAFFVPLALFAGADLSGVAYGPPAPPPLAVNPGDNVELVLAGHLDDGSPFLINTTVNDTVGSGALVPGLEAGLVGLAAGDPFNVTVPPDQGYGAWNASRLATVPRTEPHARVYSLPLSTFERSYGAPVAGAEVPTLPFPSTVLGSSGSVVALRYEPIVNATVQVYTHWPSTVLAVNNTTVVTSNNLFVGYAFTATSSSTGKTTQVRVTAADAAQFTLDLNPPLAGKTLHYVGSVVKITPGAGAVRTRAGGATALSADSCERCHADAGFAAVEGSASAARSGSSVVVNLTLDNPWQHEVDAIAATAVAGTSSGALGSAAAANLPAGGSENATVVIGGASNASSVDVVVNVTAHHVHASGGKPTDLPYQLTIHAPVGDTARAVHAAPAPPASAASAWVLVGSATGFAALGLAGLSAVQGYRRHLKRAPRIKWPPWLTLHFSVSAFATVLTVVHAVAFMSTTYKGVWSWDILVGVASLAVLGVMGVTGVVMAKWTTLRAPRLRKWHFWLMITMIATGALHTAVSGTTLRALFGA